MKSVHVFHTGKYILFQTSGLYQILEIQITHCFLHVHLDKVCMVHVEAQSNN